MKRFFIERISLAILFFSPLTMQAQDVHFSQFYEMSILRNPALTGVFSGDYKIGFIARNQWSSISKPYQTGLGAGAVHIPVNGGNDFLNIGLLGYVDKAGSIDMKTVSVYPAASFNKIMDEDKNAFLSVGFTGGYVQRSFDPSKATYDNQYDATFNIFDPGLPSKEQFQKPTFSYFDMGAGVLFSSSASSNDKAANYYLGISGYHLTRPQNSFYNNAKLKVSQRWNFNGGISKEVNDVVSYQVHTNYMRQGDYNEIMAGVLLGYNKWDPSNHTLVFALLAGVFYRVNDALIPTVKVRYKDFYIACSYDMNVSSLRAGTNLKGGFEVTVSTSGVFTEKEKARTICPGFH